MSRACPSARAAAASGSKALGMPPLGAWSVGLPPSDLTIHKMILTQCAVCATELGSSLGKKCGRCSTRYCGSECQVQHWKRAATTSSAKIKAGGAEQYNATRSTQRPWSRRRSAPTTRRARRATSAPRPSTEDKGGPRAHVRAAGRRVCPCIVLGGAGKDFVGRLRRTI